MCWTMSNGTSLETCYATSTETCWDQPMGILMNCIGSRDDTGTTAMRDAGYSDRCDTNSPDDGRAAAVAAALV